MFEKLRSKWVEEREGWKGLRAFEALPRDARRIVFYAETSADWAHLGPVAAALERRGERVIRLTSDRSDRVLHGKDAFCVGFGSARTVLFRTIDADAFVMTLADLDQFHLKRSAHDVHYFYIFHSIASTHRVYREHAFDAYDTIFCVGPHQIEEVRRTEAEYGLEPKELVEHGYGRLDTLIADLEALEAGESASGATRVLVAPSWGECSLVHHGLESLLETLLATRFEVALRLHPMTTRHDPELVPQLVRRFGDSGRFLYDPDVSTTHALLAADVMISEWSGAALEYAFARLRPVVFIDTPAKIHNPNHARVSLPALESELRSQMGRVVPAGDYDTVPAAVRELVTDARRWHAQLAALRARTVFNLGRSGETAAAHILGTLRRNASGNV